MTRHFSILALSVSLWAGGPIRIVAVERHDLPPYEDADRRYRLEGSEIGELRSGQRLRVQRPGDGRDVGSLKVLSTGSGFAMARVDHKGELFPLKGDVAICQELRSMPGLPTVSWARVDLGLAPPSTPNPMAGPVTTGDPIYFLKGSAALSPGAIQKLRRWVEERGANGSWFLGIPPGDGPVSALDASRLEAVRLELRLAGVSNVEVAVVRPEKGGKYDAVYVGKRL